MREGAAAPGKPRASLFGGRRPSRGLRGAAVEVQIRHEQSQRSEDLAEHVDKRDVRTVEAVRHERRSPTGLFFSPGIPPHIDVVPVSDCVGTDVKERTPFVHGQEGRIEDVGLQMSQANQL